MYVYAYVFLIPSIQAIAYTVVHMPPKKGRGGFEVRNKHAKNYKSTDLPNICASPFNAIYKRQTEEKREDKGHAISIHQRNQKVQADTEREREREGGRTNVVRRQESLHVLPIDSNFNER
jgi:hypothetical protein